MMKATGGFSKVATLALGFWLGAMGTAHAGEQAVRWASFTPPAGTISIAVPGQPVLERRSSNTFIGEIRTRIWHADLEDRQYWIAHTELPPVAAFFSVRSVVYDHAAENMMEDLGAELLSSEDRDGELLERIIRYRMPERDGQPARVGRVGMRLAGGVLVSVSASAQQGGEGALEGFFAYVRGADAKGHCQVAC